MNFLCYLRMLFRIDFWVFAILLALLGTLLVWLNRRSRRWQPQGSPPPALAARLAETVALAGVGVAMLALLATCQGSYGTPYALSSVAPPSARVEFWTVLAVWSAVVAAALALAWFHRTAWACVVLTAFFCVAGWTVNDGRVLGYKSHVEAIRAMPVPMDITLVGDLQGADVWFNEVHLGKTPLHMTADEFFKKVPALNKPPAGWNDPASFDLFQWIILAPPTKVAHDDPDPQNRDLYVRAELNGQKMRRASGTYSEAGSRLQGQIRPGYVRLGMTLPRWEEEIQLLADRARLADYKVDEPWIAAAESYDNRVWHFLRQASEDEPEFDRVLDAWARCRYRLDGVRGPDSAMEVFHHIAAQADKQGVYRTDSPEGRAVELVLPYLDARQVVERADERLASFRTQPSYRLSWGTVAGRPYASLEAQPSEGGPDRVVTPADAALAHAIWKLDELLDRQDDTEDNLVERRITPTLIRLAPWRGSSCLSAADALGGSDYEQFVLRHRWAAEVSLDRFDDWEYVGSVQINRWLHLAANLRSPAGREFRRKNAYLVLKMAEQIVRDGWDFDLLWPGDRNGLDYLFLDLAEGPDNLAVQFWPQFDRYATRGRADSWHAVPVRWGYLAAMQPYSTPKMFVDVYRRCHNERILQGDPHTSPLARLAPELRFDVLTALVEEAARSLRDAKPGTASHQLSKANHDDFVQLLLLVPCEKSADRLIAWLAEESQEHRQRMEQAQRMAKADQFSIHHLRRLAKADQPELRRLVLPPVRRRPAPERRAILEDLLKDQDPATRAAAEKLHAELQELARRPLPKRSPGRRS